MYSRIISIVLLIVLSAAWEVYAVPAKPGKVIVTQADGTQIEVYVRGDEYFNWRTTKSGYPITMGQDGNFYYAEFKGSGERRATSHRVSIDGKMQTPPAGVTRSSAQSVAASAGAAQRAARSSVESTSTITKSISTRSTESSSGFPSEGTIRSAVILVEYKDVKFSAEDPNQAFTNQLNLEGYSVSGATGSAHDYFADSSNGLFDGQFDVYGPYTLSQDRSYYGGNTDSGNDAYPDKMVEEGVALADADGVDFSIYDYDEDGYIDNVFVYYAGHNEAEGASEDSVWPHKWVVSSKPEFDGKKLYVYACTSELTGVEGTTIAGIGTFCHEFSHVFGLFDHYDTNYEEDGDSWGTGCYDIMSYGSYNNNGNTPPLHNGLELFMIGWKTVYILGSSQDITLEPLPAGDVYAVLTEVDNEFFLIENHDKESLVWENYIAEDGLFITHVDLSDESLSKWALNAPNADTSHECFRFIVSGGTTFAYETEDQVPYPYRGNDKWSSTSSPAALSWAGEQLDVAIEDIVKNSDGSVNFSVVTLKELSGTIRDSQGKAIAGATIDIYPIEADDSDQESLHTTSDQIGYYSVELSTGSYLIEITCPFYDDIYETITISKGENVINFTMTSSASQIEGLEVTAAQSYADLSWNPQEYTSFKLSVDGGDEIEVDDSKYKLTGLTPNTQYSVSVSCQIEGSYSELYSATFETMEQVTDYPLIFLSQYTYSAGEVIELAILNSQSDETVTWTVDGVELSSAKLLLEAGEHTIVATVERADNTYKVYKKINVE